MCSKWYVWWTMCFEQIPCLRMTTRMNFKLGINSPVTSQRTHGHFLSYTASANNNLPTIQCGPTQWCRTKENSVICAQDFPHRISFSNKILFPLPRLFLPTILPYLLRQYIACCCIKRPTYDVHPESVCKEVAASGRNYRPFLAQVVPPFTTRVSGGDTWRCK